MNMLNGAFMQEQASHFAEHATNPSHSSLTDWLKVAIEAAYSRAATGEEIQRGANRILALRDKFGLSEQQAFREYCLVLLNSNEFIYLD
jgi:hypothetical protein